MWSSSSDYETYFWCGANKKGDKTYFNSVLFQSVINSGFCCVVERGCFYCKLLLPLSISLVWLMDVLFFPPWISERALSNCFSLNSYTFELLGGSFAAFNPRFGIESSVSTPSTRLLCCFRSCAPLNDVEVMRYWNRFLCLHSLVRALNFMPLLLCRLINFWDTHQQAGKLRNQDEMKWCLI